MKKRVIETKKVRNICMSEKSKIGKDIYLNLKLIKQNEVSNRSVLLILRQPKKKKTHAYS